MLRKQVSVECCGLFLHSGLLFLLFFEKNIKELNPFMFYADVFSYLAVYMEQN